MRRSHNEQGYALLIVLFLIVFIMAVSAVFIRGSLGNAKQEIKVDDSHLTVMAAEAGVDYTKQILINEYYNRTEDINKFAADSVANTPKGQTVDYKKIQDMANEMLREYLDSVTTKFVTEIKEPYSFQLMSKSFATSNDKLSLTFEGEIKGMLVVDKEEKNAKSITFTQEFKIPDFSKSASETTSINIPNMHKLYPSNVNESPCSGDKIKSKTCIGQDVEYKSIENSTVYFPNQLYKPNANLNVSGSTLYFQKGIKVENFNQFKNSELYIDVPANYTAEMKNMNGIDNSSVYLNGSLKVNQNLKMNNSVMIIRGSAHFVGNSKLSGNSLMCVAGGVTFSGKLEMDQGSKIVYWGAFAPQNGISGSGQVIPAGQESEAWEKCKGDRNLTMDWKPPVIRDVKYK